MPSASNATYSLDPPTEARLSLLSKRWEVSNAEALQRAVLQAAEHERQLSPEERIAALHQLQDWVAEKQIDLEEWQQTIRDGRR